jgi:Tfp pilus assembly protein PilZ
MKQDKRKRVRYDVKYPCMMLTSHGVVTGETRNLSQHGAFIRCTHPLQVNERLFLIIELPFDPPLELPAHVVWSRTADCGDDTAPQGVGVRFTW